ncbi:MAG: hypothetical protein R3E79_36740 [Caldilineaceae bacterium]
MNYNPLRQPAPIVLAIGAAIGLVIGLLIGWVFWPVEWTGATLRDLYPQDKAEYIAAVADAYAIYDNPEALTIAQRRLGQVGEDNLQQTFEEAIQYFQESQFSDRAIRDSNIRQLAVALSLSPPTTDVAAQVLPTAVAVEGTPTTATLVTPAPATEGESSLGWIGWLLWLFTALLLLAGGIYILSKAGLPDFSSLLKSRPRATDEIDEFDDLSVQPRRPQQARSGHHEPGLDYSFDQEEDDEWQSPVHSVVSPVRGVSPSTVDDTRNSQSKTHIYQADEFADDDDDDYDDSDFDDGFVDDSAEDGYSDPAFAKDPFDDEESAANSWRPAGQIYTIDVTKNEDEPSMANPAVYPAAGAPRQSEVDEEADQNTSNDQNKAALPNGASPQREPNRRHSAAAVESHPSAPLRTRNRVIDQHIFHYRIGMAEYDESRPIVDPQSGKYIGEFGMGASSKNAFVQTGMDQLVALEVWLFDKSDERNLGNQTRILLSEYAVDHNLEPMFLKERQDNPRPFTAQPGVHFQLESQTLLLDCTIVDVEYSASNATKGIFQEITVDMTVQQKGSR